MEQIIEKLNSILKSDSSLKRDTIDVVLKQIDSELKQDENVINSREIYRIEYLISQLILDKSFDGYVLECLVDKLKRTEDETVFSEFIIFCLVQSSRDIDCQRVLLDILCSDRTTLKSHIAYHKVLSVQRIFQLEETKRLIVSFINSPEFESIYNEKCAKPGYHSKFFAFPGQYVNCFSIRSFDKDIIGHYSNSKLSKLASEERLDSIRMIDNPYLKRQLVKNYFFQHLPDLYKTRFLKLVHKTFPELDLKNHGFSRWL